MAPRTNPSWYWYLYNVPLASFQFISAFIHTQSKANNIKLALYSLFVSSALCNRSTNTMEGEKNQYQGVAGEQEEEVKSRGLFDFMKKKEDKQEKKEEKKDEKCQEEVIAGMENVHVTEVENMETDKKDEEKKEGLFAKLHRSDSSSSSSSDEEEVGPDGEKKKKKKGLKEKIKEKFEHEKKEEHKPSEEEIITSTVVSEEAAVRPPTPLPGYTDDTSIKVEKVDDSVKLEDVSPHQDEKKGFMEKIKEKLPGQKKPEEAPATHTVAYEEVNSPDSKEKKGIFGKIMEKIKGPEQKDGEKSGETH